jgi:hypothetical protein
MVAFMQAGSLVMERKMLLEIKERAQRFHDKVNAMPLKVP